MERCLYCYKELKEGQVDYHPACARKLFGTRQAPQLPYVRSDFPPFSCFSLSIWLADREK